MQVPPESNLFYGLLQDGNDFWNATFFCGSCALLRRRAIVSINGFATETVTEDAHTALRMQRKGWGRVTCANRLPPGWRRKPCCCRSASACAGRAACSRCCASTTPCWAVACV
ncbi:glycosyltransferase family 2 protein [Komagataeibacter rhaeticus]|nr:glycosyltransferase family 2 protein [Komagataeibacter rhaeticus]